MSNDLTWITSFSDKELQSPFVIKKDSDYYKDLRQRLTHFVNCLRNVADEKSVSIAKNYSDRVCMSLRDYYHGNVNACHRRIRNMVKDLKRNTDSVKCAVENDVFGSLPDESLLDGLSEDGR